MSSRVYQVMANFQDSEQRKDITLFMLKAGTDDAADTAAQSAIQSLRQFTECGLLEGRMSIDVNITPDVNRYTGNIKRMMVLFCQTEPDPVSGRPYMYKIRVLSPDPAILATDQRSLDPETGGGALLISQFLPHTTDIRGLSFARLIHSTVVTVYA